MGAQHSRAPSSWPDWRPHASFCTKPWCSTSLARFNLAQRPSGCRGMVQEVLDTASGLVPQAPALRIDEVS